MRVRALEPCEPCDWDLRAWRAGGEGAVGQCRPDWGCEAAGWRARVVVAGPQAIRVWTETGMAVASDQLRSMVVLKRAGLLLRNPDHKTVSSAIPAAAHH